MLTPSTRPCKQFIGSWDTAARDAAVMGHVHALEVSEAHLSIPSLSPPGPSCAGGEPAAARLQLQTAAQDGGTRIAHSMLL